MSYRRPNGEIRTPTLPLPMAADTASMVSSKKRWRLAILPPYWSVRVLTALLRNWSNRKPLAAMISIPSKPASIATFAACTKSAVTRAISSTVSARGTLGSTGPALPASIQAYTVVFSAATSLGPTGATLPGWIETCDMRPTCHSWAKILPPLACTASVTWRQPWPWVLL